MLSWPIALLVVIGIVALIAAGALALRLQFEGGSAGPRHGEGEHPEIGP